MNIKEFVEKYQIGIRAQPSPTNPHMVSEVRMNHWHCVLFTLDPAREMRLCYSMGTRWVDRKKPKKGLRFGANGGLVTHLGLRWEPYLTREGDGLGLKPGQKIDADQAIGTYNRNPLRYAQLVFEPAAPTTEGVLWSLATDALGLEGHRGFEDWAQDYGYNPDSRKDSRKAFRIYETILGQSRDLREFLGREVFEQLMDAEEE